MLFLLRVLPLVLPPVLRFRWVYWLLGGWGDCFGHKKKGPVTGDGYRTLLPVFYGGGLTVSRSPYPWFSGGGVPYCIQAHALVRTYDVPPAHP